MCFAIAPGQYKNYQGERNNKRYEKDGTTVKSSLNQVTAFTESGYGMFRTLQVLGKTGNAVSMGLKEYQMPDMAAKVDKICGNLNTAANWTLIPHLPKVTQNAYNAVWGEKKGQSVSEKRDRLKVVHDLADCGAAWSYTGLMVTGDVGLKHIGDGFSLVSDMTDLECAREDYCYSKRLLE